MEAMNGLGEMNTDNLEQMIPRLPKWAQAKCRERLKKLEHQRKIMPSFKDDFQSVLRSISPQCLGASHEGMRIDVIR